MIEPAKIEDAKAISQIHIQALSEGFLATLGSGFLTSMYEFIIKKELVIVSREDNGISGFVSFSLNSKNMMKKYLRSSFKSTFRLILAVIKKPGLFQTIFETIRAPFKPTKDKRSDYVLPDAELLSIAVDPEIQKKGLGYLLLKGLEKELIKRGVKIYKVVAGEKLVGANMFYEKNGFTKVAQIVIHRKDISNVYTKQIQPPYNLQR